MRRACLLLIAVFVLLAAPAEAAERRVPQGWLGVTADGPLTAADTREWARMASAGVETVRTAFRWYVLQPDGAAPPDFSTSDAIVAAAAAHGMAVLPVIEQTPGWAAVRADDLASPPRDPATVQAFTGALVARYGPAGSFWNERPDLPRLPIRAWQIWNEPNHTGYWSERPYAPSYVQTLRAAAAGIRASDAKATVVLAGLTNRSWLALRQLYKAGAHGAFDGVALHPYTYKAEDVLRLVRYARRVMRKYGDARLPVWITELSWPAAQGQKLERPIGIEVTDAGQAARLGTALRLLAKARKRQNIAGVQWYTWISEEGGTSPWAWAGLRRVRDGKAVSMRSLTVFRRWARKLEGCAKAPGNARRCD
jgi:hypothetical protein